MGQFEKLVEKFRNAQEQIKKLGEEIVETYPNTPRLVEMSKEIDTAVTALDSLAQSLEEALERADQDQGLYKEMLTKMEESDIYSELKPAERKKLAEYLVQNKKGLADQETLIQYIERTLSQKSSSDLIAMYPKAKVIERGRAMDDGADDFDAYSAGMEAYRRDFDADKATAVKDLARLWAQKGFDAVAREFYAEALKPDEDESEAEE